MKVGKTLKRFHVRKSEAAYPNSLKHHNQQDRPTAEWHHHPNYLLWSLHGPGEFAIPSSVWVVYLNLAQIWRNKSGNLARTRIWRNLANPKLEIWRQSEIIREANLANLATCQIGRLCKSGANTYLAFFWNRTGQIWRQRKSGNLA